MTVPSSSPLPRIVILATGGTIAGAADARSKGGYNAGAVPAETLMAAVPGATEIARIAFETVAAIGSQDITDTVWHALAHRIAVLAAREDVDAILVTHGTDTMEETAFFVALTVKARHPIVFTGAMRPATAIGADGPANLYNAAAVAAAPAAAACGTLVVFNDQIHHAASVYKSHTTRVDAFASPDSGPAGAVDTGHVGPIAGCVVAPAPLVPIAAIRALPKVVVIAAYAGMGRELIDAAVAAGAQGLVIAGVGNGNVTKAAMAGLLDASRHGVVVVRSTRLPAGPTLRNAEVDDDAAGFVASGDLKASKARVLLQVALLKTRDPQAIQALFTP